MSTQKHTKMYYWLRGFAILLLVSFLMPSASALAQSPYPRKVSALESNLTPLNETALLDANISSENLSANLIQDGSFEAYNYQSQDDVYWNEYDSYFFTPLCSAQDCGYYTEAHPYTGYSWAWFGLTREPVRSASVSQVVTFPSCGYGTLQFYLWIGYAETGSGTNDVFYAKIDGNTVFTANATQKNTYSSYQLVQVPIYLADGNPHTVEFSHVNTVQAVIFNLDEVSLTWYYCPTIAGSAGVGGAALSYTVGTPQTVYASDNGWYSITVPFGWSGTVTPSKPGYRFSPSNRTYVNVLADLDFENYAATPIYTISGTTGVGDVTLSYTDDTPKTVKSQPNGSYSLIVPSGWSGPVAASHPCFTFTPPSINHSNVQNNKTTQDYTPNTINPNCVDIDVSVGGTFHGHYGLQDSTATRGSFTNVDNGPAKAASTNGFPILASERFIYSFQNSKSYAEMMGYPDDQLATDYWFTWYNNVSYSTQLRVSNMGSNSAEVKVYAGSSTTPIDTFTLSAGQGVRKSYMALDNGPLHVVSTDGTTPILASERFIQTFMSSASYSEMMGYPGDQLATEYWFPWYNNLSYSTQLRISNLGGTSAEVKVYAGSSTTPIDTLTIPAGQGVRKSYSVDNGPLHVVSTDGVTPILASERFIQTFGTSASYSEMMGYPGDQLTTEYCFPWYNNTTDGGVTLSSQLRVSNMGATSVDVKVYLAGVEKDSFTLTQGQGARKSYAGLNSGPLCVVSTDGVTSILASERFISTYLNSAAYSEMMGYPSNKLATTYWFPWYNNVSYSTELRIAKP